MHPPDFIPIDPESVGDLAGDFAQNGRRRVDTIHLHHTFMPDHRLFGDLERRLGSSAAAGLECCRRMWRFHTEQLGWSDIAQHVTIDPAGTIWLNRDWDRPPISAPGFNGNGVSGPFMIEMIGRFDRLGEAPTEAQFDATALVIAAIQRAFDLDTERFRFHNEMSAKTCPGSAMERDDWRTRIRNARRRDASKPGDGRRSLLAQAFRRQTDTASRGGQTHDGRRSSDAELQAELPEHEMDSDDMIWMSGLDAGPATGSRGGGGGEFRPTNAMRETLLRHVINLRQGELTPSGDFTTTRADLERLVNVHLRSWIDDQLERGRTPRVMLHAHGGLNDESDGLRYAYDLHEWWLAQEVYPIFFVWETGIVESIGQLLREWLSGGERGVIQEARDDAVESIVRRIGTPFWDIMKLSATRASEPLRDAARPEATDAGTPGSGAAADVDGSAGATRFALLLDGLLRSFDNGDSPAIELHAVGHSAGAIFQIEWLRGIRRDERALRFQTLSLLAPACTTELFHDVVPRLVTTETLDHVAIYALDRRTEREDPSVPFYGKSLLHLVSDGFEGARDVPILGMQRFIAEDRRLQRFLGLDGDPSSPGRLIVTPTAPDTDPRFASAADQHGRFSREPLTLQSIAMRVLGLTDASAVPPFASTSRGARAATSEPLFPPLEQRFDAALLRRLEPVPVAGHASQTTRPSSRPSGGRVGRRIALSIGIDDYDHPDISDLRGCVADVEDWSDCLGSLGFELAPSLRNEAASFNGILDGITNVVESLGSGDLAVIHYSGHGMQIVDKDADDVDGFDEVLVPADSNAELFISDDELWTVLQAAQPGALVYLFMDCCHSESNTRAGAFGRGTTRRVTPTGDMTRAHYRRLKRSDTRAQGVKSVERMNHIKYGACLDSEFAKEVNGRGRFSEAATRALRQLGHAITHLDLLVEIEQSFTGPTDQHPTLECPTAWKRRALFSTAAAHA